MTRQLDEVIHLVVETNRALRDAGERLAAPLGLTHSQRMVLQTAADGRTVPDIARTLGLTRQSVRRVAGDLVTAGLAEPVRNPRHARSELLRPTVAGRHALAAGRAAHRAWLAGLTPDLPEDDLEPAARALRLLRDLLAR